ncbi:hypothetical protein SeMB42_g02400 [Synchytrium endobioticum]|uniref:Dienelactone hydrolase domain-containing protein n=1 Tax=Synchytrium endobioticum TaxID=286115 RepID=A0A507DEB2_9FUNG|nr:hypothetical protein SeLEV6574_g02220 [Synchytrium endobioticum]TPX50022.1 hypothetical protein SeMB42_g02400 [Synchytrium endobioticum]
MDRAALKTLEFRPDVLVAKSLVGAGSSALPPVIIALQEWWGVNDQIKSHAQRIANGTGAIVIVPDMYDGKLGLNAEEASHLMGNLDWVKGIERLESLVDSLRDEASKPSSTDIRKVGCIGFCMGSALALALAARYAQKPYPLDAIVGFYGVPGEESIKPIPGIDIGRIPLKTHVRAYFGKLDPLEGFSDYKTAKKLEKAWEDAVKGDDGGHAHEFNVFVYDEYGHAFMNDDKWCQDRIRELNLGTAYNPDFVTQIWAGVFEFFTKHLKIV